MGIRSKLFNSGFWFVRLLFVVLIASLFMFATDQPSSDSGVVSAAVEEWDAQASDDGFYGYLRQLPAFQEKDGEEFSFFAKKTILVFGEGQVMLVDWIPDDLVGKKFQIRFAYLDRAEVEAITAASKVDRDGIIKTATGGARTQTTGALFNGQAGFYSTFWSLFKYSVPEILMTSDFTPEFDALLKAKYPSSQAKRDKAKSVFSSLALDVQIYPPRGIFQTQNDTRVALYIPGYAPGIPVINKNDTEHGWNNEISMDKDPELWMNAQGLTYQDMADGKRRWGVVMGWNSHLDYDGRQTFSKDVATDKHPNYRGMLTPVDEETPGLVMRAMALLDTTWSTVPLVGDINIVSHSTGYYLAMDLLHYRKDIWPKQSKTRYFAISPNIRGSSLIGATGAAQAFDSQDDMYRDNWHWDEAYRKNENTLGILKYDPMDDVEAHVMLAYGDTTSAGIGGTFSGASGDSGVVDYTNYQPHFNSGLPDKSIFPFEIQRRHRFSTYESLFNMNNDGDKPLNKAINLPEWKNGGDDYLRNFRSDTILSVFGKNVNLEDQEGDDEENYQKDHSALAARMAVMKMIVNGQKVPYVHKPGESLDVVASEETPGVVKFSWTKSPSQSETETDGHVGGQLYEIVRRIEGNEALAGADKWEDKWFQRVALERADGGSDFEVEYNTYETIRAEFSEGDPANVWRFSTSEFDNQPTWLDRSFDGRDLWVRVLNGPLEGGFFKVKEVQDFVGIGYKDKGALADPPTYPNRQGIIMTLVVNTLFGNLTPEDNYITLGGIKYQYNVAFFGPVDPVRTAVTAAEYSDETELTDQGTGHFMSVELGEPKTIETDTISPTISFGMVP